MELLVWLLVQVLLCVATEKIERSCPAIPDFQNGAVMSTGLTYGKFSHFICDDGFTLQGQQYLVCLGNVWSYEFPQCIKKIEGCEQILLPEHLLQNTTSVAIGTAVQLDCTDGHVLRGEPLLECLGSGEWDAAPPACHKITCPQLEEIDNAIVVHSNSGRRVDVTCEVGYAITGPVTLSCAGDGEWDSEPPVCVLNICQLPSTDSGEWYRVVDRNIALLRCNRGYTQEGDSELFCNENNEWSSENVGRCVPKSCPALTDIQEGRISTVESVVGTVAMVTCSHGFATSGHWKLTCLASGEWDYASPSCQPSDCQILPPIDNGYVSSQQFKQGSLVDLVCEQGYKLVGENSLLCLTTGKWSAAMPRCELFGCVSTPLKNGTITEDVIPLERSSSVVCEEGFSLQGPETVLCTAQGTLTIDPETKCIPKSCHVLSVENGDVAVDDVIYGSIARVTCHYGYSLQNSEVARCQADGTWTAQPECEEVVCPPFPVLYRGYLEGETYSVGSTADLICDVGYKPKTVGLVNCTAEGTWSSDSLECVQNGCPALQHPEHGMFVSLPGSKVALLCNEGYKVLGAERISCVEGPKGGRWNNTIPLCALDITCPVLAVPYKGMLSTNSTEYGTQVSVSCTNGHVLSHTDPVYCNISGIWNGSLPSCNFPDCPDISSNGITLTGVEVGDTARVDCESCQKRLGEQHSVCKAGGVWEPPIGSCHTVTCKTKINKRLYESVEGAIPTQCGKSVTFVCKPGYTTIGRTTITCYDTGQYDYHVPFCVQSGIFRVRRTRR